MSSIQLLRSLIKVIKQHQSHLKTWGMPQIPDGQLDIVSANPPSRVVQPVLSAHCHQLIQSSPQQFHCRDVMGEPDRVPPSYWGQADWPYRFLSGFSAMILETWCLLHSSEPFWAVPVPESTLLNVCYHPVSVILAQWLCSDFQCFNNWRKADLQSN